MELFSIRIQRTFQLVSTVEVETGFAAVSFPVGDKRADLFIP